MYVIKTGGTMERKSKQFKISDIFIGLIFTLFFLSIGVIFTLNFRPMYYFDIDYLNIPEKSGYDKELIKRNYDVLIDYNSPFYKGDLEFPDLPSSPQGLQHFIEVKDIFTGVFYLAFISFIACVLIVVYKNRKLDYNYLLASSVTVIVFPIIIALIIAIDFDKAFLVFHKIFFDNDYWIFSPKTDPIIKILPQTFFLHCVLLIILIILLGSLLLFISYKSLNRKKFS